jgi:hypothetical protein
MGAPNLNFTIDINIDNGKLHARTIPEVENKDNLFAFYILKDGQTIEKIMYSKQNEIEYDLMDSGVYKLRCFLKNSGSVQSKQSDPFINGEKKHKELTYFYEDNKSPYLVIVFASMLPKNTFKYSYMNVLRAVNSVNKLFILDKFGDQGCYYLGKNRSGNVEEMVIELVDDISKEKNIDKSNIITIGSSKGGYAALYYAIKYNFGNSIVGAPQVLLGNYLLKETSVAKSVAEYIAGSTDEEAKNYLNQIMTTIISQSRTNARLFIHIGNGEPHYKNHFLPLIKLLEQTNITYEVDIKDYATHDEVAEYYPPYLQNKIEEIAASSLIEKN